ncbi:MAG TPA: response regulator [Stellaceae bacterium]|nr:response regulator [Stellaceae bacterium]
MSKVLIIDDDVMVRETIAQVLEDRGYEVVSAEDGQRGMARFREECPDLVITDIIMPEKEGIETIMQVRGERPGVPIIAISGGGRMGNTDFLMIAQKLGASAVLAKPFDPDDLVRCAERCLQAARRSDAARRAA